MNINGYILTTELNNANSGFSKWGFAQKDGKEYFIKELITPVYPIDRNAMSPELFDIRRKFCEDYETRYRRLYGILNNTAHGNIMRIQEFFRHGSKYYITTEKVSGKSVPVSVIAQLSDEEKYLLLKSVVYGFVCLHKSHIVHFDVKPSNIFVKVTRGGKYVGKLIDFDSGFFTDEERGDTELGGDLTYLAPETFLAIIGEEARVCEKADIFSLGLVFHQYFSGELPLFNKDEYEYPYEAVLSGDAPVTDSERIPQGLCELIRKMLAADPDERPSAQEVLREICVFAGWEEVEEPENVKPIIAEKPKAEPAAEMKETQPREEGAPPFEPLVFERHEEVFEPRGEEHRDVHVVIESPKNDWFHMAGDL